MDAKQMKRLETEKRLLQNAIRNGGGRIKTENAEKRIAEIDALLAEDQEFEAGDRVEVREGNYAEGNVYMVKGYDSGYVVVYAPGMEWEPHFFQPESLKKVEAE